MLYYSNPTMIQTNDVKKIVNKDIVDNTSKLFSAILKKDYSLINKIYKDLRLLKIDNYALTTILGKNFSDYLIIKELDLKNASKKDMEVATGLRSYAIDNYLKFSNSFSIDEVKDYIIKLANIDYLLKIGEIKEEHALDEIFNEI